MIIATLPIAEDIPLMYEMKYTHFSWCAVYNQQFSLLITTASMASLLPS